MPHAHGRLDPRIAMLERLQIGSTDGTGIDLDQQLVLAT